jgi:hypothetical protein
MNLWKKTLLATAVAAISTGALAVDLATSTTSTTFSAEGFAAGVIENDGTDTNVVMGTVTLTSGAEYSVGDIITLTISGGVFADDAYTLTDTTADAVDHSPVTFGLLNSTDNTLTFRVTTVTEGTTTATTVGSTFVLSATDSGLITMNSIAAGAEATVTAAAETSTGITIDDAGDDNSAVVAEVKKQFTYTVDAMDATIDVSQERKDFALEATPSFTATVANPGSAYVGAFVPQTAADANVFTVEGAFAAFTGVDTNGTFAIGTSETVTIAEDEQSATTTLSGTTAPVAAHVFTFDADDTAEDQEVITAGDYSVTLVMEDASGNTVTLGASDAGSMSLNGASVDIPYVPYGDNLEQFIWVTNKGSQSGEVTVTAMTQDGTDYELGALTTSEPGLTRLADLIETALAAEGVTADRVQLNVTVNAPSDDINVYAAYKVTSDSDRLTLPTVDLN